MTNKYSPARHSFSCMSVFPVFPLQKTGIKLLISEDWESSFHLRFVDRVSTSVP